MPKEHVITASLLLVAKLRELNPDSSAQGLFGHKEVAQSVPLQNSTKLPYFKTKLGVRPVFDQTVMNAQTLSQGPFKKLTVFLELHVYQPFFYISDFWLLEKDYVPLNMTLEGQSLNVSLSYSVASMWAWSLQPQMTDQWTK